MPRSLSFDGIRESDWFELIVEGVPVALLMADQSRRISLVNRNTEDPEGQQQEPYDGIEEKKQQCDRPAND